jgi:hypothetical protein
MVTPEAIMRDENEEATSHPAGATRALVVDMLASAVFVLLMKAREPRGEPLETRGSETFHA